MRLTHGLRAITLATLVALAGVPVLTAPVAATDPTPTPTTTTATPTLTPTPTPTPVAATDPAPTTTMAPPSPIPAPTLTMALVTAPAPAAKPNLGASVVRVALAQRHRRYVSGAMGPWAFDCSGLVRYAYRYAGVSTRLGGGHSALAMYRWARVHHLTSRSNPRVGDVVVYGGGTHVGIYIGNGRVISALNPRQGIRITGLYALRSGFTAFIHTSL